MVKRKAQTSCVSLWLQRRPQRGSAGTSLPELYIQWMSIPYSVAGLHMFELDFGFRKHSGSCDLSRMAS